MKKIDLEEIKKAIENTCFDSYGIRVDECKYEVGDIANNSHELYQDPDFDEDGNLIYPEGEGIYEGFYDAGEIDGTCTIGFDPEDDESIQTAIERVRIYWGKYVTVVGGDGYGWGNDPGELIICNAEVLAVIE